jgi:hypothetical protein
MRVDWAIISRYAETNSGLATLVGAGIDTFFPGQFPAQIALPLTIQFRGRPEEIDGPHEITLRILDSEMTQIGQGAVAIDSQPNPNRVEGWEAGLLVTLVGQAAAAAPGTYSIEIAWDGDHKKSVPFRVVAAPTAAA